MHKLFGFKSSGISYNSFICVLFGYTDNMGEYANSSYMSSPDDYLILVPLIVMFHLVLKGYQVGF